ncbi:MAG TPA: DUF4870 domain-containing protein [Thermoanaerobaculia bacterium]|nr:DUF4870 domain-containing protein [Thermoanaerobaculia bacterium]
MLSYLGILCLIPLLTKKDDADIQWHAKNGTALFGAEIIWVILVIILTLVRIPLLGCGITMISCVVWIGFLAVSIFAIMKAMKGERLRLPLITDFAEKM